MNYISTRGEAPVASFAEALLFGLARDGGLYVPATVPQLSAETIRGFAGRPYADVAEAVIAPFVAGAFPEDTLRRMIAQAYATFRHPAVTPLTQLGPICSCWSCSTAQPWPSRMWQCSSSAA